MIDAKKARELTEQGKEDNYNQLLKEIKNRAKLGSNMMIINYTDIYPLDLKERLEELEFKCTTHLSSYIDGIIVQW